MVIDSTPTEKFDTETKCCTCKSTIYVTQNMKNSWGGVQCSKCDDEGKCNCTFTEKILKGGNNIGKLCREFNNHANFQGAFWSSLFVGLCCLLITGMIYYVEINTVEKNAIVVEKTMLGGIFSSDERCVIEFDNKREIVDQMGCKYSIGDNVRISVAPNGIKITGMILD